MSKPCLLLISVNGEKVTECVSYGSAMPFRLGHRQNTLAFEFSSIPFGDSNKIRYRLQGFDGDWSTTSQRYLRYTHLPPNSTHQLRGIGGDKRRRRTTAGVAFQHPVALVDHLVGLRYLLDACCRCGFYLLFSKKRQWQMEAQLEMEHREAKRLQELDALKTKIYTNITHEFRTPLTVILGMVKQIKANPKDWYSEGLQMIERNGRSLLRLVNQMLNLSKLEAG
ncbi:MAG: hypothetical protein IPM82_29410 [Saprospiraceae bacterium]|nr:hypothetical protein [Saprospiraceae bacterium]